MALIDGLVEYFPLSEASGNRVGLHAGIVLTDEGSTPAQAGLTYSNAAHFTFSANQRLWCADNAAMSAGDSDFTIGFAFYMDSVPGFNLTLFAKSHNGSGAEEYKVQITASGHVEFVVWDAAGGNNNVGWTAATIAESAWYRCMVFHDAANDLIGISVNGGAAATQPWANGVGDRNHDFQIGHNAMAGRVGPWARWNRILSGIESSDWDNGGALLSYAALAGSAQAVRTMHQFRQRMAA
jgi:hypothetical protein